MCNPFRLLQKEKTLDNISPKVTSTVPQRTRPEPPRALQIHRTIASHRVVIVVEGTELHAQVVTHRISSVSAVIPQRSQLIALLGSGHQEVTVPCHRPNPLPVLQQHVQHVPPRVGQLVDLLQAKPKFTVHVAEAALVIGPTAVKVHRARIAILDHNPVTVFVSLVAEHRERFAEAGLGMDQLDARVTTRFLRARLGQVGGGAEVGTGSSKILIQSH